MALSKEIGRQLKSLGSVVEHYGPRSGEEIKKLEQELGIRFPSDYRQFLGNYGSLIVGNLLILGLGNEFLDLIPVKLFLHTQLPDLSVDFIPIEALSATRFAGLICSSKNADAEVVAVDIEEKDFHETLANSFSQYLESRLTATDPISIAPSSDTIDLALSTFERHVIEYQEKFNYDHAVGGKLPRNHDWRPYRFCIQDVLFGATVVRHERVSNSLEVDVFLTAHPETYDELAGAHALTAFLLSESYKCGGTMEIRFTKNVEKGHIPQEFRQLAARYNIVFAEAKRGCISPQEAKAFYAALTDITPELQDRLQRNGRLRLERACFVIHHGIWSREQVEMLALASQQPESILSGMMQPHQRHLYMRDLLHVRGALLAGTLDRRLLKRDRVEMDGQPYDLEDDVRLINIKFDPAVYARSYWSSEALDLTWGLNDQPYYIPEKQDFAVLIRARDNSDLKMHYKSDIEAALHYRSTMNFPIFVLYPQDFRALSNSERDTLMQYAYDREIGILICPEFVNTLDREGMQKLARSRVLRQ